MSKAEKLSLNFCKLTCPDVDDLASNLFDSICSSLNVEDDLKSDLFDQIQLFVDDFKTYGTLRLRGALIEACDQILTLEAQVGSLESDLEVLR